jgi:hypothetical protein
MAKKTKSKRIGEVRCQHCFERFHPPLGVDVATCPTCGWEWYISWAGKLAKIRKPVWESWERQISQAQQANDTGDSDDART